MTWLGQRLGASGPQQGSADSNASYRVPEPTSSVQQLQQGCRQTLSAQAAAAGRFRGKYSAMRSLELLRLNVQNLINKEIDEILKRYITKFFEPAIANIEKNLGEGYVTDENVRAVCIQMLEDAKTQYYLAHPNGRVTPCSDPQFRLGRTNLQNGVDILSKRKELEGESCDGWNKSRKKVLKTVTSILPGSGTAIKSVKLDSIRRDGPKWDPGRITKHSLFIMGARANKVLGFGQTRGRLYTKHPEILKYSGDTEDKEWLSRNNLMPPTGGIAYLLLLEDIRELAESEDYRNNPNVLLHELKGFEAPDFMLKKIKNFICEARTDVGYVCNWNIRNYDSMCSVMGYDGDTTHHDDTIFPTPQQKTQPSSSSTAVRNSAHDMSSSYTSFLGSSHQTASSEISTQTPVSRTYMGLPADTAQRASPALLSPRAGAMNDNDTTSCKSAPISSSNKPVVSSTALGASLRGEPAFMQMVHTGQLGSLQRSYTHVQSVANSEPGNYRQLKQSTPSENLIQKALLMSMDTYHNISSNAVPNFGL